MGYFDGQFQSRPTACQLICGLARLEPAAIWVQALWPSLGKSKSFLFCHKTIKGGVVGGWIGGDDVVDLSQYICSSFFLMLYFSSSEFPWIKADLSSAQIQPNLPILILIIIVNIIFTIVFVYSRWTVGGGGTNCISITVTNPSLPPTQNPSIPASKFYKDDSIHPSKQPFHCLYDMYHLELLKVEEVTCRDKIFQMAMCRKTLLYADYMHRYHLRATIHVQKEVYHKAGLETSLKLLQGFLFTLRPILSGSKFQQSSTHHFTDHRVKRRR